ncbi:beta strand repeat-containing protein [Clostridium drakei]|uniref:Uncharacterized protein n=1 Tax=Clostridium drakei TaxID=332101 RepID=A0A2U8DK90_9CLOT|nr:hypothetical protein [Clostridium drakei]AWI03133.1 hypothetical protein B9W14_00960 [Clostridium drakei]
MADTALTVAGKYSLYNKTNGTTNNFVGTSAATDLNAVAAFANTDKTQIKFTISAGASVAGFPQGGLANAGYILYATGVDDRATVANTIVAASPMEFNGTLTPDTAAANVVSATYNRGNGQISLTFDKAVSGTPADDAVYVQVGTNKVLLKAADYVGIGGTGTITRTISPAQATIDAINALGDNPQIVLGDAAFTTSAAGTVTPVVTAVPTVSAVSYDDTTNRMTFTFSEPINVAKFATALGANKVKVQTTSGDTWANINGSLVTPVNSATVTVVVDQTTARALEAITIEQPKLRITLDGTQNLENVTDIETAATTPVQFVEKDYSGIVTLKKTALSIVSTQYTEADHKLKVTFNKDVRVDADDSTKLSLYVNDTLAGVIGTDAATPLAIASEEITNDGKTLTYTLINTHANGTSQAEYSEIETAGVKAGTDKVYLTVTAGAVTDQGGLSTFAVPVANKVPVTYVATPAAAPAASIRTADGSNYVKVKFDQVVDKTTAETVSNYIAYLVSDSTVTFNFDSATLLSDQQTVYLHSATPLTLSNSSYKIGIKNIAAKVGGAVMTSTYAYADSQALTTGVALAAPALTDSAITATNTTDQNTAFIDNGAAGMNAGDTFVVTFDKPVVVNGNVSGVHDVIFTNNNNHDLGTGNITVTPGDYANQLKVSLGTGYTAALGDKIGIKAGQTAIKFYDNTTNVGTTDENKQVLTAPTAATAAPAVKSAVYADANNDGKVSAGDTLTVVFDQNLDPNGVAVASMTAGTAATDTFVLPAGTSVGDAATFAYAGADSVTITLGGNGIDLDATAALSYLRGLTVKAGTNNPVRNTWTVVADGNGTAKTVTSADTTRPSITGATYSTTYDYTNGTAGAGTDKVIIVSFGEKVNAADMDAAAIANNFALSSGYSFGTAPVAKVVNGQVVIKLDANAVFDAGITTINVVAGDTTQTAVDASGNKISRNASSASGYVVTAQ